MKHEEKIKLVDQFIEEWSKINPTLDKGLYWSGVMDGVELILKSNYIRHLKFNANESSNIQSEFEDFKDKAEKQSIKLNCKIAKLESEISNLKGE